LAGTFTVGELCGDIRNVLQTAFGSVWVAGEVQRVRPNRNGHLFFELIEKGAGDEIVGKLEAVIWRRDYREVRRALDAADQEIADGQEIRLRATVDFYAPFGRMQLVVREIDAVFALGRLAARRRATLAALTAAGLLDRNRQLPLSRHPLELALVTARGSAAYHDFLAILEQSGFGFRVRLIDAAMQGRAAENAIATALEAASGLPIDACVLIRGGGSKTDLAAFDSRRVAEAVARSLVPVLTGLGHQIDESIADRVAHAAFETPSKVAGFLIDRIALADVEWRSLQERVLRGAMTRLERARDSLRGAETRLGVTRSRVAAARGRLEELAGYLARTARRAPGSARKELGRVESSLALRAPQWLARGRRGAEAALHAIARTARGRLRTASATLEGHQRLAAQLGPERALARGFTITRDEAGRVVRRSDQIGYGETLITELADGSIRSRVEEA
jgi:exodeoxyribonuclease VII large subunit